LEILEVETVENIGGLEIVKSPGGLCLETLPSLLKTLSSLNLPRHLLRIKS